MTSFESNPLDKISYHKPNISFPLKLFLEMGPLAIFYLANAKGQWIIDNIAIFKSFNEPIFPATALFILAILVSLLISYMVTKTVPVMPLFSAFFVAIFGSLTLWFHDSQFIKFKPTIMDSIIGFSLLIGLYFNKSLIGYVFDSAIELDEKGWKKLTFRCGLFFIFLAITNEFIWRNFSTELWTKFKVFGVTPLTMLFFATQIPTIMKHIIKD